MYGTCGMSTWANTNVGRVDRHVHGQRVPPERLPDLLRLDRAAAECQYRRPVLTQRPERHVGLERAELELPTLLEELRDRLTERPFQLAVDVDEPPAEPFGDLRAQRRLPRAHEADERDVAI